MQDQLQYDYAVVRVVPKVQREEFINAGIIISSPENKFLETKIELDEKRLLNLDPEVDLEVVKKHLQAFQQITQGKGNSGISKLNQRERFHWLTSPKSTIIQTSSIHSGYCTNLNDEIEHLLDVMVRIK